MDRGAQKDGLLSQGKRGQRNTLWQTLFAAPSQNQRLIPSLDFEFFIEIYMKKSCFKNYSCLFALHNSNVLIEF